MAQDSTSSSWTRGPPSRATGIWTPKANQCQYHSLLLLLALSTQEATQNLIKSRFWGHTARAPTQTLMPTGCPLPLETWGQ